MCNQHRQSPREKKTNNDFLRNGQDRVLQRTDASLHQIKHLYSIQIYIIKYSIVKNDNFEVVKYVSVKLES